jgi:hypothetical protein
MKSPRDQMIALLIREDPTWKKAKAAPRVASGYSPEEEDDYADFFSGHISPQLRAGRSPNTLDSRARAANEMKIEIEKLIKELSRGDSGGDIKL